MRYTVRLARRAERYLDRLDRRQERRVRDRLEELSNSPHDGRLSAPLHGRSDGLLRSRVGDLRILFYLLDEIEVVDVTEIGPRGDIYKGS